MATERAFCRFNRGPSLSLGKVDRSSLTIGEIPIGGFCLSTFLVISESGISPKRVLMGHLNPAAAWDQLGALDDQRVQLHSKGWMLPSCHLIYGEAPKAAAERILLEQLGLHRNVAELDDRPRVFSDLYTSRHTPAGAKHWDLGFIYRFELNKEAIRPNSAWSRLEFVDVQQARAQNEIARAHSDVIEYAGL